MARLVDEALRLADLLDKVPYRGTHEAAAELRRLHKENENLRSVMVAAAEEISAHWEAHCDPEGYGPANLMHRLERGIATEYSYKAGDFARLCAENASLKERLSYREAFPDNFLKDWQGLTDNDKQIAFDDTQEGGGFWEFADAIEAKLRRLSQSEREGWRYADELEQERKRLTAVNQELLEALKEANAELEYLNDPKGFVSMRQEKIMEKCRAAISKAEA